MTPINLLTTDRQLNDLQHAVNEAREGTIQVRVDKQALWSLLRDHARLHTALRRDGQTTEAPQ